MTLTMLNQTCSNALKWRQAAAELSSHYWWWMLTAKERMLPLQAPQFRVAVLYSTTVLP